ncbi:MAG: efflux transporter outer membrane subunit [Holophagales bacterium]|nr:efflux transporter outer membrane subunit [Holophagales bacterium]
MSHRQHRDPASRVPRRRASIARRLLPLLLASFALAQGCASVGPDYEPPVLDLPASYDVTPSSNDRAEADSDGSEPSEGAKADDEAPATTPDLAAWWLRFGDPVLRDLVERALGGNLDLAAALARLEQARSLTAAEISGRYPTLDATGSATRASSSENAASSSAGVTLETYALGLEAGWELDLWGRVRRTIESARGDLAAAAEDARGVLVSVAGSVGRAYVDLRGFEARLAIAEQNEKVQEQTLELVEARYESGLISQLDVVQARASLDETRATIPGLRRGVEGSRDRLAVLSGLPPGSLDAALGPTSTVPVPPAELDVGAPAELLRRRPDVRAAERRLAAATARIGVAEAELYPQLRLTGAIGFEATSPGDLLSGDSVGFSFGPSLRWNLFDTGRLRALVGFREAEAEENLLSYRATVLEAIREVEGALEALRSERQRLDALDSAAADYRQALELSRVRYRNGLVGFQTVLDAQRSLFAAEDALETSRIAIAATAVDLYRALGGGWDPDTPSTATPRVRATSE